MATLPTNSLRTFTETLIFNAFRVLKENEREMKGSELMRRVGEISELPAWAEERLEKTGNVRWQSELHLQSITAVKAGFLVKKKGVWYLTEEGAVAMKDGAEKLFQRCKDGYAKWKANESGLGTDDITKEVESTGIPPEATAATFSERESQAQTQIEEFIRRKNPYEFQDLCAALLRGMGYYTPFVAPRGPDGGVDIIAYRDPLGALSPRIKVQIKHRESPSAVDEVRKLAGIIGSNESIGIFISSGGFTSEAKREAMRSHVHVELIDLSRLIDLWEEFYSKLSDEDKQHLPLQPIYFLAPES